MLLVSSLNFLPSLTSIYAIMNEWMMNEPIDKLFKTMDKTITLNKTHKMRPKIIKDREVDKQTRHKLNFRFRARY